MNCMNCGAVLTEAVYCPKCGCDVVVQKQAIVLSGLYYNQGLEKAGIRDLSGAIDQLKRSLKFNKLNVSARNLLGLIYFETGEVVAALSEWVISKNIMSEDNVAGEYIEKLQADPNKLDTINQTIKKYNQALRECREGNEDIAKIQLKKVLTQNPKLIKGYHLLALLYIHDEEYEKARRILKKAVKIDKTNTTTLRFLREVDEQTGTNTAIDVSKRGASKSADEAEEEQQDNVDSGLVIQPPTFRESSVVATLLNLGFGFLVGAATVYFLLMPARTQSINRQADEKISEYSSTMATQKLELERKEEELSASHDTVQNAEKNVTDASDKVASYDYVFKAQTAIGSADYDTAAAAILNVNVDKLSEDAKSQYNQIKEQSSKIVYEKRVNEGVAAYEGANYPLAVQKFTEALTYREEKDYDYDVMICLADSYERCNDLENAKNTYKKISEIFANSKRAEDALASIERIDASQTPQNLEADTFGLPENYIPETDGEEEQYNYYDQDDDYYQEDADYYE